MEADGISRLGESEQVADTAVAAYRRRSRVIVTRRVLLARWTARGIGGLIMLAIALHVIGFYLCHAFESRAIALIAAAELTAFVGLVVAWRWEGVGGGLVMGGSVLFHVMAHGSLIQIVFNSLMLTVMLYLMCWWSSGRDGTPQGLDHTPIPEPRG